MTSVLITGGTGFIGSRLALRCRAAGTGVRVLAPVRNPVEQQRADELGEAGVEVVAGSVTDAAIVREACAGVTTLYHLAAAQHEANVPDRYYHEINVEGTRCVLQGALEAGVQRVVHGSTIGVYGVGRNGPVGDASPLEPDNIYGITKLEGETVAREFMQRLPVVIVRISETYGPGDRRLLKLFRGIQRGRFAMIGPGRNMHHPVYVDDLLDGLEQAAATTTLPEESMVLAGPNPVTSAEMIADIAKAIGRPQPRLRVPLMPLLAVAAILEGALRPVGIQPPLHRRRMNFFIKSFRFTCAAARATIGYAPKVPFAEGAVRTAAWYRAQGLL